MNSKLIRTLIIINGILIPVVVLTFFGIFLIEYINSKSTWHTELTSDEKPRWETKFTSPQKILNSENYFIAKYQVINYDDLVFPSDVEYLYGDIPENTLNIVFLDKDFKKVRNLLQQDAAILQINIPNLLSKDEEKIKKTNHITYFIATEDTNNDESINQYDDQYFYISYLDGQNLTQVLDKKVTKAQFINDYSELLITFEENDNLAVGIYNIKDKAFTRKNSLNFED